MKRRRRGCGIGVYVHKCSYEPRAPNPHPKKYYQYVCLKVWKGGVQRTRSLAPLESCPCFLSPQVLNDILRDVKSLKQLRSRATKHPACSSCFVNDECAIMKLIEDIKLLKRKLKARISDDDVIRALRRYLKRTKHKIAFKESLYMSIKMAGIALLSARKITHDTIAIRRLMNISLVAIISIAISSMILKRRAVGS